MNRVIDSFIVLGGLFQHEDQRKVLSLEAIVC